VTIHSLLGTKQDLTETGFATVGEEPNQHFQWHKNILVRSFFVSSSKVFSIQECYFWTSPFKPTKEMEVFDRRSKIVLIVILGKKS
jgi:hypothetical protein